MNRRDTPVRASLFVTCLVDQFYPEVGESAVRVLRRLGVDLDFPSGQTCCGQPAFNAGFWSHAKPLARRFLRVFRGDRYVVAPSGSCASMVRVYYPHLLEGEPELVKEAQALGGRVYELSQFIADVLGVTDLSQYVGDASASPTRKVTYQESCHLSRELGVVHQPRTLLRSIPGVEMVEMEQAEVCCGFGGSFSVKYPDISAAMLQDKIDSIRKTGAETVVACDAGCLMHLAGGMEKQGISVRSMHLAQLLAEAIRPS